MKRLLAPFALAALAAATDARAQSINTCSSPPKTPKGHIVVRVKDATEVTIKEGNSTKYRTKLVLDKGADAKIEQKDEAYLLTCEGRAVLDGEFRINEVTPNASSSLISGGKNPASLKGAYVAIDTGFESKKPPMQGMRQGYNLAGFVTNVIPEDPQSSVTLGAGMRNGVFPGDAGYLIDPKGMPIYGSEFTVDLVTDQAAQIRVKIGKELDAMDPNAFGLKASKKTCTPGSSAFPKFAQPIGGNPPAGYLFASTTRAIDSDPEGKGLTTLTVELDKGSDQGVLPSSTAWLMPLGGMNAPVVLPTDITWVSKSSARLVLRHKPNDLRYNSARVLVSVATCK